MAKQLTVTIKIDDGNRHQMIQTFVPDNLLTGKPNWHTDQKQDEAVNLVSTVFCKAYTDFVRGGEDNGRGTEEEGRSEEREVERGGQEASQEHEG